MPTYFAGWGCRSDLFLERRRPDIAILKEAKAEDAKLQ
jgi:hypothetical protein